MSTTTLLMQGVVALLPALLLLVVWRANEGREVDGRGNEGMKPCRVPVSRSTRRRRVR